MNLVSKTLTSLAIVEEGEADNLDEEIYELRGMSGKKGRQFLNELCYGLSYVEIGSWMGSTFVSAMYGNCQFNARGVSIDNFSQFADKYSVKDILKKNCEKFLTCEENYELIDADCLTLDLSRFKDKFDVFFYDGHHGMAATRDAIMKYVDIMNDQFVLVVDDYTWATVKQGTEEALKLIASTHDVSLKVETGLIIPHDPNKMTGSGDPDGYWNGLGIFVLQKK
jgi:hypothetical protein